jgi:hypothetical protein
VPPSDHGKIFKGFAGFREQGTREQPPGRAAQKGAQGLQTRHPSSGGNKTGPARPGQGEDAHPVAEKGQARHGAQGGKGAARSHQAQTRSGGALQAQAEEHVGKLLAHLDYVGALALELFEVDGQLLANEIAPRVHNTGHYTIEGARVSQFENHLRAILGLPLGAAEIPEPCAMLNLIGTAVQAAGILAVPDAHLHWYGKEPRPGRKVGHVTVRAPNAAILQERVARLEALIDSGA